MRKGFSVVELAMALVVVGLIAGGIMAARSMVGGSQIQAVIGDWQRYAAAAESFNVKYGYWPGDFPTATANWSNATYGTVNGNGDNLLGNASSNEYYHFWHHLKLANLNQGNYTGSTGSIPKGAIRNSYIGHYYDSGNTSYQSLLLTGGNATNDSTGIISGKDSLAIDTKIDDTYPETGQVRPANNACVNTTPNPDIYDVTSSSLCTLYYTYKNY